LPVGYPRFKFSNQGLAMAIKRNIKLRTHEEWLCLIDQQSKSKKNAHFWCHENGIPTSSFYTAYRRFFPKGSHIPNEQSNLDRSSFQEIAEITPEKEINLMEINFGGITITIKEGFDESFALKLLKILGEHQ
jgi:hypothetical protein